jgi:hypothetical protein
MNPGGIPLDFVEGGGQLYGEEDIIPVEGG